MRTHKWPVIGAALAVLWLFVRGVSVDLAHVASELLVGLLFGLPIAFVFRRLYAPRTDVVRALRTVPYALLYITAFLWELATANVDVAYRVLAPSMPVSPDVIVVPLRVQTSTAITTIANSITLTPGTLTMDYDEEHNALYVHTIDGRDPESVVAPIRTWEDYALVIFDEERQPGDPAPDVVTSRSRPGGGESSGD